MTAQEKTLQAYWVGEHDLWAAEDDAQALQLANGQSGTGPYTLDEVMLASGDFLDARLADEDGKLAWTVRGLLQAQTEPGYLLGVD